MSPREAPRAISLDGAAGGPKPQRAPLDPEKHAFVAARLAVHADRPRAEVLSVFGISEAEWDDLHARFNARIVDEIRERCGSDAPLEERYPLSSTYAKAYATAVRDAKRDLDVAAGSQEDERTVRLPPDASRDEPFSVFGASNRAATADKRR